jgi:hypothetical protein
MIPEDGIPSGSHLQKFLHNWKRLTKHRWPLSAISEGYQIQFQTKPAPWKTKKFNLSAEDQMAVDSAVQSFLAAQVIEKSPTQDARFLSNFFTIKEATKVRPILDCIKYVQCNHFKMESVPSLRELI